MNRVAWVSGRGQTLRQTSVSNSQRPKGASEYLGQIVARDVFYYFAAGANALAAAVDQLGSEQVIAQGTHLKTPRPREVASHGAADGSRPHPKRAARKRKYWFSPRHRASISLSLVPGRATRTNSFGS